jgi:3-hydroxyisobutyrate dehydrogenase-like beta-hydroxyacid dehydrogenase
VREQEQGPVVGVVGLGAMGGPMAGHLLRAGLRVLVADLDPDLVDAAVTDGAQAADLEVLGAQADVVLVVVATDEQARAVCQGLLRAARPGTAVLLCSSVRPDTCAAVASAAPEGVAVLDAALTGGVRGAELGTVNLLVGGDAEVLDRVRPALAPWTASVHHLGPLGAGQVGKTANNLVHWAQICAIAEALELGRRYGLDVATLRRALMDGPTDSRTLRELERMRLTWHAKDLANAAAMAARVGLALPVAETSRQVMQGITVEGLAALLQS